MVSVFPPIVTLSLPVQVSSASWDGSNRTVKVQLPLRFSRLVVPARLPPETMQELNAGSGLTLNPPGRSTSPRKLYTPPGRLSADAFETVTVML
jgi:hypothetical protein